MENTFYRDHVTTCDDIQKQCQMIDSYLDTNHEPVPNSLRAIQTDFSQYEPWANGNEEIVGAALQSGEQQQQRHRSTTTNFNYDGHIADCNNFVQSMNTIATHLTAHRQQVPPSIKSLQNSLPRYLDWAQKNQSHIDTAFQHGQQTQTGAGAH